MTANFLSTSSAHITLALANHLWQSTLVLAIVALLTLTLRQTSARIRYWLWLTASIKFLIPFSLLMVLGAHLASLHPPSPHPDAQAAASFLAMEYINQPFTLEAPPIQTTRPAAATQISIATRAAALWNRNPLIPATLASLWLAGFFLVITRWMSRWWKISSAIRRTHTLHDGHELETLRRMERLAGLHSAIEMKSLPASMEPGIFGIIRPVLLWPQAITAHLQPAHLEAVLAHEVCHVQRRDNLTAGLHMLVEAIFWFHPLVWWLETRLVEEREHACDETVLQLCGQRTIYAESILKVCEFCIESPLACVSGVTGADLKKRIVQIMTGRTVLKLTLAKKLLLTATALLVVAVPIMLGQTKTAQQMMAAAMNATPTPFRAAIHAMMPVEDTPSTGLIAEMQTQPPPMTENVTYVPTMKFDVASVRETQPDKNGHVLMFIQQTPHSTNLRVSFTIGPLLNIAYGIDSFQIVEAPNWPTVYTIEAKGDADADAKIAGLPPDEQRMEQRHMLQTLLEERFKLKTHWETKQGDAYNLVVAKGGPKLGAAGSMPPSADETKIFADRPVSVLRQANYGNDPAWIAHGCSMSMWAEMLTGQLGRPVADKTGLTGKYDFVLKYKGRTDSDRNADDTDPTPPMDRALQEQLGLKVEPTKAPVKVLVVEHIEKPSSVDGAEVPQSAPQSPAPQSPDQLAPMAKDANPSFEVATIKPSKPGNTNQHFRLDGHHVSIENETVTSMICVAYGIHKTQIIGAPAWFDTDPYDIDGVPDTPGEPTWHQQQQMLQKLLADRFAIKFHHEKRELAVYAITVAKGGPKLTPNTTAREGQPDEQGNGHGSWRSMKFTNNTMSDFALNMQFEVGKPVIDQTGLTGRYDYTLKFTTDEAHLNDPDAPPGFFTAIQEQLGLKLEPKKDQAEVLVIDHAERPSEN
jgi:bla regulator protein blaR1